MKSWPAPSVPALPGRGPQLRLYDSADRQVRPVTAGQTATMYVCGITPYDATHLGHAATYLTFDLVHRVWLDSGHRVHYVQNVTDVDDPLFERAERDGIDWRELADRETDLFREDMAALRVVPPHDYVAATETIAEVIEVVEKMLASGAAYVVDDAEFPDVYYRADATRQFGYESGYDRDTMMRLFAERGGDPERAGKGDALDASDVAGAPARRTQLAVSVRPRSPRLARGMRGDSAQPHRNRPGYPGRRQRPDLSSPRVLGRTRRIRNGGAAIRPPLRARGHDRVGRPQDEQEPGQPCPGVGTPRRRDRSGGDPAGPARRSLPRRPVVESGDPRCGDRATATLAQRHRPARGTRLDGRGVQGATISGR